MAVADQNDQIDAEPTKAFFVDILIRDIPLETAILDLVDNSVDGAKRSRDGSFDRAKVEIEVDSKHFRLIDNCGGFDRETARKYAFRFGRAPGAPKTPHSIGQFGVGMKRALFKFGRSFVVRSATKKENWAVDVSVDDWEARPDWHFPWSKFKDTPLSNNNPGTEIIVTKLRAEVASKFGTEKFEREIIGLIKSKHRQFIAQGLSVTVNRKHIDATDLNLLFSQDGSLKPGVETISFDERGQKSVSVRITVGVGSSFPKEAGWYVICNGRVILEADRSKETGWGLLEEESGRVYMPSFHNQFARFRGIVSFDSEDSSRVPWDTTKNSVDQDSAVWQAVFPRMIEMMRPAINFLNELDKDIDEHTRSDSPMLNFLKSTQSVAVDSLTQAASFQAPTRQSVAKKGPRTIKIQYARSIKDVDFLKDALGATSASAVGEKTFDLILKRQRAR